MGVSTTPNPSDRSRWLLFRILTRLNEIQGIAGPVGPTGPTGAPGVSTRQSGKQAIGSGVDFVSVTFAIAFASAPVVTGTIGRNAGDSTLTANIDQDSISTTGFTVHFSSTTDNANYKFNWTADVATQ